GGDTFTANGTNIELYQCGSSTTTKGNQTFNPVATCTPTPITPYVQVDGGTWQQTSSVTVNTGSSVRFGPQPPSGGAGSWSGPNAFSATSREVTVSNVQSGQTGSYVTTYTNSSGCKSKKTFSIALSNTVTGDWSNFVFPTVTFTDNAIGLEGSTIFHN